MFVLKPGQIKFFKIETASFRYDFMTGFEFVNG